MPESFDGMLAELADAAAAITPLPDVASVRRRAHERRVHRRMAASALALVLLGTCGGTLAAVSAHFRPKPNVAAAVAPGVTAKVTTAATPPVPPTQAATPAPGTAAAEAAAYTAVAGTWQPVDGGRYLIVFPDGEIGVGEAGAWQLCDGRLAAVGSGDFSVGELACGDYGTTGLMLQSTAQGKELALVVPARSGAAAYTVSFQRAGGAPAAVSDRAVLTKLVGQWTSENADKRSVLVTENGTVVLIGLTGGGGLAESAGTVTGYYTDGVRVEIPCTVKPGAQGANAECGVVELQQTDGKEITVVGSYGSETFLLSPRSALLATSPLSTAPTAANPPASPSGTVLP